MKIITIDDAFNMIGHLGYSQFLYFIILSSLQFFTCSQMLLNVFQGLEPTFKCFSINSDEPPLLNKCYNNSISDCLLVFDHKDISLGSEFNLVCDKKYKVALVQSIWMGGVMAGALLLGSIADVLGRMKTLVIALLSTITFEGFSAFAPTFNIFIGLRFAGGMCCSLIIIVSFVLSQELVGMSKRSVCGLCMGMFFAVGLAILSLLASQVQKWRMLGAITSLFGLIFMGIPLYVPESPRWLLGQGRINEAEAVIQQIADRNGTASALPTYWKLGNDNSKVEKSDKKIGIVRELFQHSYVTAITFIQIFSWFVNSLVYYALTMAASNMGGDIYMSTVLNGLVEIPANIAAIFIIDWIGRRIAICGFMLVGGIACLAIQLVPPHLGIAITSLALLGKLSISASFSVIYIHSGEVFPTPMRNTCMGIVSVAARIGGIVSPFILMLGDIYPNLQFSVLGLFSFLSGVLNLKLPETKGKPMPQTVLDILALRTTISKDETKYSRLLSENNDLVDDFEENDQIEQNTTLDDDELSNIENDPLIID